MDGLMGRYVEGRTEGAVTIFIWMEALVC